ncbi:protein lifeguard 1-like [Carassius gibelio]|uniref:protein lifeguard 1-like n=1 Tax=Carassius gibelio TaxID=101364 RepID=UPI002279A531|nr:protein lifeguard 1-like [Carassius gibelio]
MSKSDPPPSYEESREQQHGNYPFPPYGYAAQPGVYTGPGQPGIHPQAGLWQGPGYYPSAMPSMMPSFITPGIFSSNLTRCILLRTSCWFAVRGEVPWLHMLYGACGAIVFTLFLAYHTQLLIGNRANTISPDEYVFGALSLYVDIVQIFIFLLHITGGSSE